MRRSLITQKSVFPPRKVSSKNDADLVGVGPWPCLNRASEHYSNLTIQEVPKRSKYQIAPYDVPRFVYRCQCGYVYSCRTNQNPISEALVVEYGPVWEEELRKLSRREELTQTQAASSLGISLKTLLTHGLRLGIPRYSQKAMSVRVKKYRGMTNDERRDKHRKTLLDKIVHSTNLTRSDIYLEIANTYKWLRNYDFEWLKDHLPEKNSRSSREYYVDYKKRDSLYVENITKIVKELRENVGSKGRPIRITVNSLVRLIDGGTRLHMKKTLYPQAWKVILSCTESNEDYKIRKLHFAYRLLKTKDSVISDSTLRACAGVRRPVSTKIQNIINQLIEKTL